MADQTDYHGWEMPTPGSKAEEGEWGGMLVDLIDNEIDNELARSGPIADRPPTAHDGALYRAVDEGVVYRYDGAQSNWDSITPPSLGPHINIATEYEGTNGGEMIQAAVDDLPPRGGMVYIPMQGPDDRVVDGNGHVENGAWEVRDTITTTTGQNLTGAGIGWREGPNRPTGTSLICTDSSVGAVVSMEGEFLQSVERLTIDGGGKASTCLSMGGGLTGNDFLGRDLMVADATDAGVEISGQRNYWLDTIWTELNGYGIQFASGIDSAWINNVLSYGNGHSIRVDSDYEKVWIRGLRDDSPEYHSISFHNGGLSHSAISSATVYDVGTSSANSNDAINVFAPCTDLVLRDISVLGNGQTRYAVHDEAGGSLTDCTLANVTAQNMASDKYSGIVGSGAGTRTVIDGTGYNAGDPTAGSGDWASNGREGVIVYDDSATRPWPGYRFVGGSWQAA